MPGHQPKLLAALLDSDHSQVTSVDHGRVVFDTVAGNQLLRHLGGPSLLDKGGMAGILQSGGVNAA